MPLYDKPSNAATQCARNLQYLANNYGVTDITASEAEIIARSYLDTIGWETLETEDRRKAVNAIARVHWTSTTRFALGMRPAGPKHEHVPPPDLPLVFSDLLADAEERLLSGTDSSVHAQESPPLTATMRMAELRSLVRRIKCKGEEIPNNLLAEIIKVGSNCEGETSRVVKAWIALCARPCAFAAETMSQMARNIRGCLALFAERSERFASSPLGYRQAVIANVAQAWNLAIKFHDSMEKSIWSRVYESLRPVVEQPVYQSGDVHVLLSPGTTPHVYHAAQSSQVAFALESLQLLGNEIPQASTLTLNGQLKELSLVVSKYYAALKQHRVIHGQAKPVFRPPMHAILTGPSGTGKSYTTRAIAKGVGAPFFELRPSDIFEKWQGQAVRNLRRFFDGVEQYAHAQETCAIVCIDEIDAFFPRRDRHNPSNSEADQVVDELLQITDTTNALQNTIIIGSTNRWASVDEAFRRRFSEFLAPALSVEAKQQWNRACFENELDGIVSLSCQEIATLCASSKTLTVSQVKNVITRTVARQSSDDPLSESAFFVTLHDALVRRCVTESGSQSFSLPPRQGQGFSAKINFTAELHGAIAYIEYKNNVWELEWIQSEDSMCLALSGRRIRGNDTITTALLTIGSPEQGVVSSPCQARIFKDTWLWDFAPLKDHRPGTIGFSQLFLDSDRLLCTAQFFEPQLPPTNSSWCGLGGIFAPLFAGGAVQCASVPLGLGTPSYAASVGLASHVGTYHLVIVPLEALGLPGAATALSVPCNCVLLAGVAVGASPVVLAGITLAGTGGIAYGISKAVNWISEQWRIGKPVIPRVRMPWKLSA